LDLHREAAARRRCHHACCTSRRVGHGRRGRYEPSPHRTQESPARRSRLCGAVAGAGQPLPAAADPTEPTPAPWAGLASFEVAAEATGAVMDAAAGVAGELSATGPLAGLAGFEVAAEVTDGVTDETAEVTGAATDAAAHVGEVAACACRENTSRTASIPAASSATCTARRAMCRKIAWDTSSSGSVGRGGPNRAFPQLLPRKPPHMWLIWLLVAMGWFAGTRTPLRTNAIVSSGSSSSVTAGRPRPAGRYR